jgi:hypothetical protein
MEYAEFRLVIRAAADGACVVTVDESLCGGAILARTSDDVAALMASLTQGEVEARRLDEAWCRGIGCSLFDFLFKGPVLRCLRDNLLALQMHQKVEKGPTALRIRLHFGAPGDPADLRQVAHLAALPWELLYDLERGEYLCLQASTPIVRTFDAPFYVPYPLAVDPPLRILVVAAQPPDQRWLNLAAEITGLQNGLAGTDAIELKVLPHATFPALQEELQRGPYHVFHFMGHGKEGQLLLESPNAEVTSDSVSTAVLARLFGEHKTLRLAVLNSCKSAQLPDPRYGDSFAAVAAGLIQAVIPAVVAMQLEIQDSPAIDFAGAFYRSLASNEPLELAVTRGRRAITDNEDRRAREIDTREVREMDARENDDTQGRVARRQTMESLTPVLYSRTREGRLFDVLPVVEVFGIRFRKVGGIHLAERHLTAEDWARIDPSASIPGPRPCIAWINQVFKKSGTRAQRENPRVSGLRLPTEAELRSALLSETVYYYCTTGDGIFPYAAITPEGNVERFQSDDWNTIYGPHCVVRPVVELVSDQRIPERKDMDPGCEERARHRWPGEKPAGSAQAH